MGDSSVLVISSLNRHISHACSELHSPFNTSVTNLAGSNTSAENEINHKVNNTYEHILPGCIVCVYFNTI